MTWLAHVLGLDDASGPFYLFWSGICANLSMVGAAVTLVRKHNCHQPWCWRIGHYPEEGTPYQKCGRHHPEVSASRTTRR